MFVLHQKLSRHVILSPVYSFKEQCILGLITVYLAHILLVFLPGGKKKKKKDFHKNSPAQKASNA